MNKKLKTLVLFLICGLVVMAMSAQVLANNDSVLVIRATENSYANMYRDITIPSGTNEVVLETRMRIDSHAGNSWGPGITLYWDYSDEVTLKLLSMFPAELCDILRLRWHVLEFSSFTGWDSTTEPEHLTFGDWYDLRIVYMPYEVEFYAKGAADDNWIPIAFSFAFDLGDPEEINGIIIGKTVNEPAFLGGPLGRKSYTDDFGNPCDVYIDYVTVVVDGKEILRETFSSSISELEADGWDLDAEPAILDVRPELTLDDIFSIIERP